MISTFPTHNPLIEKQGKWGGGKPSPFFKHDNFFTQVSGQRYWRSEEVEKSEGRNGPGTFAITSTLYKPILLIIIFADYVLFCWWIYWSVIYFLIFFII